MKLLRSKLFFATVAAVLAAGAAVGCATHRPTVMSDLTPHTLTSVRPAAAMLAQRAKRPTVAIVLGGGGLRGFAHIGALKALYEMGIQPDLVVGTSAGALVGAAYASGMLPRDLADAANLLEVSSLVDWTLDSRGLIRGDKVAQWVDTATGGQRIEQFPIRFAAVATDLDTAQPMILDRGRAGQAVQASAAVPGMQVPVAYRGGNLIDGGVASLVPVRAARAMGADVVIAVDIYCHSPRTAGLAAPSVVARVMQSQSCLLAAPEMAEADVLITPAVTVSGMSARQEQQAAIDAGYQAVRQQLPRLTATFALGEETAVAYRR